MVKHTVTINGLDITNDIIGYSYSTSIVPVFTDSVVTLDGVEHTNLIRTKGTLSFQINPVNAARTKAICDKLTTGIISVSYFSIQDNGQRNANMKLTGVSAEYLYGIVHNNTKWNRIGAITLTEL